MNHKAGFVNIIGLPNVGKSTLMNALVGEKMSIITPKAQTTRHRIFGIVNSDAYQIVYSDTPGLVTDPGYKLHQSMNRFVSATYEDADVLLFMTHSYSKPEDEEKFVKILKDVSTPVLVLINKIDLLKAGQLDELQESWIERIPGAEIYGISALERLNLEPIVERIIQFLPVHPPYFPKDELTDRTQRFFVSEIIREKIFLNYKHEIPYSCEVAIEAFKEEEAIIRIKALIYVSRKSQKGILIGKNGAALKKVGTESRIEMESFLDKKVFLELYVKVSENWRNDDQLLKRFGYR